MSNRDSKHADSCLPPFSCERCSRGRKSFLARLCGGNADAFLLTCLRVIRHEYRHVVSIRIRVLASGSNWIKFFTAVNFLLSRFHRFAVHGHIYWRFRLTNLSGRFIWQPMLSKGGKTVYRRVKRPERENGNAYTHACEPCEFRASNCHLFADWLKRANGVHVAARCSFFFFLTKFFFHEKGGTIQRIFRKQKKNWINAGKNLTWT